MKQTNENISTTANSDYTECNGHQDDLIKARKDSDNDDAATNTSSSSSTNLNNSGLVSSVVANPNELIVLPESSFNIRIQSTGLDTFELPVTSSELVQEIHQVLMDKEETCHRTCFSLQLDGIVLDNFTELKNIDNLKEGTLLKVIEEQYTVREVRIHVRHINELIHSCDLIDLYNGSNGYSLCMVNDITNGDIASNTDRKKAAETNGFDFNVPEYLLPSQKDILVTPLFTTNNKSRPLLCLKVLSYSGWNPPNGSRKLHGDLMYLQVATCEEKSFHITASTKGFYVSQTTEEKFIPKPVQPKAIFHSLVDLLNNISPIFKKNFAAIQRKRCTKHPFERIQIPCQIHPWLSPRFDHTVDYFRAEDANINKLGHEDHIPGQVRDWNEELQITKELSKKTLPERLIRERAMFKVHSDFVAAAIRGCQAVVDGNIMAINPGEESKVHMYIWNNMFFSLGFDVKEHYKDFGGDAAAHAAPTNDLQGVRALNTIDLEGLHTLGTAVVDYRGMRVTAQTIVPGILEKEQEQSVVYGSTDFGKTCVTNEKYKELLEKVSAMLKIKPHTIKTEKGDVVELLTAVECKGIVGNDGRHYLLDLLRMMPPDLNYLPVDVEHISPAMKQFDYPKTHKHRLCCLRQELIDAFIEQKYVDFYRSIALNLSKLRSSESSTATDTTQQTNVEEAKRIVNEISVEDNSREIIQSACRAIGSVKDNEFDVRFNPDLFQPHVTLNQTSAEIAADIKLLKEAAEYLVLKQIPLMIQDFQDHSAVPVDGESLSEAMHSRGINIRYLGRVAQLLNQQPALFYLHDIAVTEILCRSAKHLFRSYIQSVPIHLLSFSISHFLNCLLTIINSPSLDYLSDELFTSSASATSTNNGTTNTNTNQSSSSSNVTNSSTQKSANKKKNKKHQQRKQNPLMRNESLDFLSLTSKAIWSQLTNEAKSRYNFDLNCDDIDSFIEKYNVRRTCILRSLCLKTGLQLSMREFQFDQTNKSNRTANECFNEDDIINIYPLIKQVPPKPSDAYQFFTTGQQKIQQGLLREGFELISEAHNLLNNVYGPMHPEISMCLRLLARLNYIMGDYHEALYTQHKAVMMSERVLGVDHPQTATEYIHMALYSFANGLSINASKLLCRARYIILACCGENHPQISLIDSNLGLILQSYGDYENALKFMEKSLELSKKFYGLKSLKVALSHHLCARIQSCRGDFRSALSSEREAYQIYKLQLGDEHERTRESAQVLQHLTEQAVVLQKRMNDVVKGQLLMIPSITIQQPSFQNVLEMLNVVNGILFIQIREKDLDLLREELAKQSVDEQQQQQQQQATTTPSTKTISEAAEAAAALMNDEVD
ncbi:unnamed protein product [Rotaria magnacalcarata]|uniref:Clustered mitochondria protein homolog n=1 Tax=Rotaria magnacalcarata TaxID=392030 RepID=A0A814I3Z8_9BILA|nr:unnamed protein product [Rotaria magnacalcarata]CAF2093753.1 unnamed protein product [Rotaria magnacalcarata]